MSIRLADKPGSPDIRSFLERLGSSRKASPNRDAAAFHDPFFSLDPAGASLVTREQLTAALPGRVNMFASIGATGTRLTELSEVWLDDRHVLVTTEWDVDFVAPSAARLTLPASYLLRRTDDAWEILVYLNHRDIRQLIAARSGPGAEAAPTDRSPTRRPTENGCRDTSETSGDAPEDSPPS